MSRILLVLASSLAALAVLGAPIGPSDKPTTSIVKTKPALTSSPFTWKGAWSSSTAYVVGDAVSKTGSSYICILAHSNHTPPNATYWGVLASKGDAGAGGGVNGLSCWDLDGDGTKDAGEDVNADGTWNAIDCKGAAGEAGDPASETSPDVTEADTNVDGTVDQVLVAQGFMLAMDSDGDGTRDCLATGSGFVQDTDCDGTVDGSFLNSSALAGTGGALVKYQGDGDGIEASALRQFSHGSAKQLFVDLDSSICDTDADGTQDSTYLGNCSMAFNASQDWRVPTGNSWNFYSGNSIVNIGPGAVSLAAIPDDGSTYSAIDCTSADGKCILTSDVIGDFDSDGTTEHRITTLTQDPATETATFGNQDLVLRGGAVLTDAASTSDTDSDGTTTAEKIATVEGRAVSAISKAATRGHVYWTSENISGDALCADAGMRCDEVGVQSSMVVATVTVPFLDFTVACSTTNSASFEAWCR